MSLKTFVDILIICIGLPVLAAIARIIARLLGA